MGENVLKKEKKERMNNKLDKIGYKMKYYIKLDSLCK